VAESSSTTFTLVKPNLFDLTALGKEFLHCIFGDLIWQSSNPNCVAIRWSCYRRGNLVLARSIRLQRLILCEVHSNRDALEDGPCQLGSFVHGLRVEELDVAEVAIAELIDFQTDHFNLPARLEEVDDVLFSGVDREIAQPERVAIGRFYALRFASQDSPRSMHVQLLTGCYLIHVGVIDLNSSPFEYVPLSLHRLVDAMRVFELNMCKVSANIVVADLHFRDSATILEEVANLFIFWSLFHPANPNGTASIRLVSVSSGRPISPEVATIVAISTAP